MHKPRAQLTALSVGVLVVMVGCSLGPTDSSAALIALEDDIGGFNELVSVDNATTQQILERLFLDLLIEGPDSSQGPPSFSPRLAERFEISADGKAVTFYLQPDATWSDGVPVTAEDVRWTWQAQTSPEVAWDFVETKRHISDVEVVNDKTVRFHFSHAYANQLVDANEGVVLPKHAWSQLPFGEWRGGEDWFREHLVVSGPYEVEHYTPEAELILVANDRYFEPDLPTIQRLIFQVIPDANARVRGLLAGELDFIPKLQPFEASQVAESKVAELVAYPHRQYDYISWNVRDPLLADQAVRRALTLAIDCQEVIDTLLSGYAQRSTGPILSTVWAHSGIEPWPHDPERALAIFGDAGWSPGKDGKLRDANGDVLGFSLAFNADNAFRRDAAAMLQEQWRRIGVEVTLLPEDFGVLSERLESFGHQAYLGAFLMDTSLDLTVVLHSSAIDNGYNFSAWSNPEVDRLIDRVKSYDDILDARGDLARIQEIVHQQVPMTFLWEPMRINAKSTRLTNVVPNLIDTYANMRSWRLADPPTSDMPAG